MTKQIVNANATAICWDTFGMGTSCLCAIHCMMLPLLIGFLPAAATPLLHGPFAHSILAIAVLSFCCLAIVPVVPLHNLATTQKTPAGEHNHLSVTYHRTTGT